MPMVDTLGSRRNALDHRGPDDEGPSHRRNRDDEGAADLAPARALHMRQVFAAVSPPDHGAERRSPAQCRAADRR